MKSKIIKQFQTIPGVGKSIAEDLWNMGLRSLDDLVGEDAEALYERLCVLLNARVDRCMLSSLPLRHLLCNRG